MAETLKPGSGPLDYGNRLWLKLLFVAIFIALYAPIVTLIAFSFNTDKRGVIWRGFTLDNYAKAWNNVALQPSSRRSSAPWRRCSCGVSAFPSSPPMRG
jgi:spermidine/putrescine transport system permease protein